MINKTKFNFHKHTILSIHHILVYTISIFFQRILKIYKILPIIFCLFDLIISIRFLLIYLDVLVVINLKL